MTKNNESLEAIIKQRDIAVGALEFYANNKSYEPQLKNMNHELISHIDFDRGDKAKRALASIKEVGE